MDRALPLMVALLLAGCREGDARECLPDVDEVASHRTMQRMAEHSAWCGGPGRYVLVRWGDEHGRPTEPSWDCLRTIPPTQGQRLTTLVEECRRDCSPYEFYLVESRAYDCRCVPPPAVPP